MRALTVAKSMPVRINLATAGSLAGFAVLGALLSQNPVASLSVIGAIALFALSVSVIKKIVRIQLWQILVLMALVGYVVLNYGFTNLAFHAGGVPIILGDGMMFAALGLASFRDRRQFVRAMRHPAMLCVWILIAMAVFRLCFDVPRFGIYAVRDASMFIEGIFLALGLIWAMDRRSISVLMKSLMALFVLNFIYTCTFPARQQLSAWSPKSGIFLKVPLLGAYGGNDCYLLAGSLFCMVVGRHAVRWPRSLFVLFALVQMLGLAMLQARTEYLSLLLCLGVLALAGRIGKCAELIVSLGAALATILLLTSVLGVTLSGRVGPVNLTFLREHASSLLGNRNAPAEGTIQDREEWWHDLWWKLRSSSTTLLLGEGFGEPLIHFGGSVVPVRQPHNTHLSVLARMGALALLVWVAFNFAIIRGFLRALRARAHIDDKLFSLVLWLFLLYIILMVDMTVQPGLEFSYGAVPFYFQMGVALGITRFQLRGAPNGARSWRQVTGQPSLAH